MSFWRWFCSLFGGRKPAPAQRGGVVRGNAPVAREASRCHKPHWDKPRLAALQYRLVRQRNRTWASPQIVSRQGRPYHYAHLGPAKGQFIDLSQDARPDRLARFQLPNFRNPDELAAWLKTSPGELCWVTNRPNRGRPEREVSGHYHLRWIRKRSGGWRLIEAPKPRLKQIQTQILDAILSRIPAHHAAHGFVPGHSTLTNATPHVGKSVVVKMDLTNFYATVRASRVIAIFRSLGYSREAAIWLGHLTTSVLPSNAKFPAKDPYAIAPYLSRHLPQGAPTSPALANLSAYSLDVRLSGLAKRFNATYTRYADDLTFSGGADFDKALRNFIPLAEQIIRSCRFHVHKGKRKILRRGGRQRVTGIVVNDRPSLARPEFDRLKAILHNCRKHGVASQNRENDPLFRERLCGSVAYAIQIDPKRGAKLQVMLNAIHWSS